MIFRSLILALAAAAAFATATAVIIIALAFALYAVVEPHIGRAGAAACVAGAAGLLIVLVAMALAAAVRRRKAKLAAAPTKILQRVFKAFKEKPLAAAASAGAAVILAVRSPIAIPGLIAELLGSNKRK